ncbi:MAG: hypothetical protein GY821_13355 [Gammaproteobacteria bacterium]|nr:hypothetical protein [Gammaproteobacteria bacterium]
MYIIKPRAKPLFMNSPNEISGKATRRSIKIKITKDMNETTKLVIINLDNQP